ncbi:LLM class F420-dependent oxidoreductase [Actinokineospora sp. 24-640]
MKLGLCYFPTDYGMGPGDVAEAAEERGFESLFFCEHTHIPVSRRTPFPRGGDLPEMYRRSHDLFVALTAAAMATSTLRVGSGVCLLVQRDPITTAKAVASLDRLSGGRLDFGVGAGWNREEMANHGTDPTTRMRLLGERVRAMRQIWAHDEAEFHGEFVDFDPIWSWPKPTRPAGPPVLVGGMGPTVESRVLAWGDGWLAQSVDRPTLPAFTTRVADLQRRAADAGRPPVPVTLFAANPELVPQYAEAGVDRCLFLLPDADAATVTAAMDRLPSP